MSDTLKQVGKTIGKSKRDTEYNLTRYSQNFPMIERVLDIFDSVMPFVMEFITEIPKNNVSLNLYFYPLYNDKVCEIFDTTNEDIILAYPYVAGSTTARFKNTLLRRGEDFSDDYYEDDPTTGEVVIGSAYFTDEESDEFAICYTIDTLLAGLQSQTFYPENIRVWIDNVDITRWIFGSSILSPDEDLNIWRNIDISSFVRGAAVHTLKVTCESRGKVEARIAIR